jgi:hypothetical protein
MEQLETVPLELSSPGLIQAPRSIDDDVSLFRDHPVVYAVVAVTVTVSKDLPITIERGLYGRRKVGESCFDVTVCHGNVVDRIELRFPLPQNF